MAITDPQPVKSKRDSFKERLSAKYPDKTFDDDETMFGQIGDDYDEYDRNIKEYDEREKAFSNMFTSDPRSARLMMEWKNGSDPAVALMRIYGDDILAAKDDPEKQEEIAQANKEFAEKVAKEKEYEKEYDANLKKSLEMLDAKAKAGTSDDAIDNAMEKYCELSRDFLMGKITEEAIDLMLKAINYDADVERASAEGEVAGRNARIEEKLRKPKSGDGTVALDSKNSMSKPVSSNPDLGALSRFDGNPDIFERGGEKRKPVRR